MRSFYLSSFGAKKSKIFAFFSQNFAASTRHFIMFSFWETFCVLLTIMPVSHIYNFTAKDANKLPKEFF